MSPSLEVIPNAGWDPRITVVRDGRLVDVFVIVTDRFTILVDTLYGPLLATELLGIANDRRGERDLLIVNSHADWDHAWGNQVFGGNAPVQRAPIIATRLCAERLRSAEAQTRLAEMQADGAERFVGTILIAPDICFDQELTIAGGDLTLELFPTPGHQPDHCSIWIPEIRTLLAGDAAEAPFPFAQNAAALPAIRSSLARMAALEPQTVLYCHAPTDAGPQLLHSNIAYFDALEQHCRAALAKGVAVTPPEDADLEAMIGLTFEQALPFATQQPEFYRPGHLAHIRMMLEWCSRSV